MLGSMGGSMLANALSGGGGASEWMHRWMLIGLGILVFTPLLFSLWFPAEYDGEYADIQSDIEEQYLHMTGSYSTPQQNIWTLTGIYTPYNSEKFGWTSDGWLYGTEVREYSPSQYQSTDQFPGTLTVKKADNGIWYYTSVPDNFQGITLAEWDGDKVTNVKEATVYSSIYFDNSHKSDRFFTTTTKTETAQGYYYDYSGYRYTYQPLSNYNIDVSGTITKVDRDTTSLSLIWYRYSTLSGIAGQLTISGSDSGVSYITSDDIIRVFNSANSTAVFDMTFNGVPMHLLIRMDPSRLAWLSVADCYNQGYWNIMVYSDAVAASLSGDTYEFNINTMWQTIVNIFTFNLANEYDIDGWEGFVVSVMFSMVLYSVLLVIAMDHPFVFIIIGLIGLIQTATTFLGSGAGLFDIL